MEETETRGSIRSWVILLALLVPLILVAWLWQKGRENEVDPPALISAQNVDLPGPVDTTDSFETLESRFAPLEEMGLGMFKGYSDYDEPFDIGIESGEIFTTEGVELAPGVIARTQIEVAVIDAGGQPVEDWKKDIAFADPDAEQGGVSDPFADPPPKSDPPAGIPPHVVNPRGLQVYLITTVQVEGPDGVEDFKMPAVVTRFGQRAKLEIIREQIQPDEWSVDGKTPVSFETINTGMTVELDPSYSDDGLIRIRGRSQFIHPTAPPEPK